MNDSDLAPTGKKQIDQNEGEILKELQQLRSTFERFLQDFESSLKVSTPQKAQSTPANKAAPPSPTITQQHQQISQQRPVDDSNKMQNAFQTGGHKEFDPLANKKCKKKS